MLLPNIWGGGQLFAFSGLEGETGWPAALVAVTLEERIGLDFYSGRRPRMWLALETRRRWADGTPQARFAAVQPTVVTGDLIVVELEVERHAACRVRIACVDRTGMLGEVAALAAGVRAYLVLDLSPPGADIDQGGDGEVIVAAEGEPATPRWLAAGQRAFQLRPRSHFAVALDLSGRGGQELLQALLSADLDELCQARLAFFERVPQLPGADDARQRTFAKCFGVLKVNLDSPQGEIPYRCGVPDRAPHRYLWLWDAAFHALGYARLDMSLARETLLAALSKVRPDGFLPHRLTPHAAGDSDITQPPLLGWAARQLHQWQPDPEFLRRAYDPLCRYLGWDLRHRDADGDGLLEWVSGAESGMDNSPRFDAGTRFAAVDFNAFAAAEAQALADIAAALERPADAARWQAERDRLAALVEERLWHDQDGIYYDRAPDGQWVRIKTCASFVPLFAGIAAPERAQRLVEHLTAGEFWPAFPVPSVALDEPAFGDDMWRGPTWLNYNLLLIEGLRRYNFPERADELRERCLEQVADWYAREGAIFEFYDPWGRTSPRRLHRKGRVPTHRSGGIPLITDYNWSAAAFVALASERYGIWPPPAGEQG